MAASYQAENWVQFEYAYVDQDEAPIDVSGLVSVTLFLFFPKKNTKEVVGSYSDTADKNLVVATAKTILNSDLSTKQTTAEFAVEWQFKVVLVSASEPIWSPIFTQNFHMNLG